MPALLLRIAQHHKQAEALTKQWLMGVRRGWLSLLKPAIRDYNDVMKAFAKLEDFVVRLEEQVKYVRRGPNTYFDRDDAGKKLDKAFQDLYSVLEDQRSKARYWKEYLDGTAHSLQWGEDRTEDAKKTLEAYRRDFESMLEGYVPTKGKGPSGVRSASVLEFFDRILKVLYGEAKVIQLFQEEKPDDLLVTNETVFKEFALGRMKVVVVDPEMKAGVIPMYLAPLKKSQALLAKAGFEKVWYGITFIVKGSEHELSPYERESYQRYGYDIFTKAGDYNIGPDVVRLWNEPSSSVVSIMCHELGHRYWYKFMSQGARLKFKDLLKTRDKTGKPPELKTVTEEQVEKTYKEVANDFTKATQDFTRLLEQFEASKFRKYEDDMGSWGPKLIEGLREFSSVVNQALGKAGVVLDRETSRDFHAQLSKLGSQIFSVIEDIQSMMLRTPEPTGPVPNLTKYWNDVYREQRAIWVKRVKPLLDEVVTYADHHLSISILEHNKKQRAEHAKAVEDYDRRTQEYESMVPPVSGYGATNADEAFAEAFAHYVLGRNMTRDQIESFKTVLSFEKVSAYRFDSSKPLYHGTSRDFDAPKPNGLGVLWLTPNPKAAAQYGVRRREPGYLWEVYLKPGARILRLDDLTSPIIQKVRDMINTASRGRLFGEMDDEQWRQRADFGMLEANRFAIGYLKSRRVDGVVVKDTATTIPVKHMSVALLRKSAIQSVEKARMTSAGPELIGDIEREVQEWDREQGYTDDEGKKALEKVAVIRE